MKKLILSICALFCLASFTITAQANQKVLATKQVQKNQDKKILSAEEKQYRKSLDVVKTALDNKRLADKNKKVKSHTWVKKAPNGFHKRYQRLKKEKAKKKKLTVNKRVKS